MDVVLLGPPGVGKGTQGKRLASRLRVPHVASGDIFRAIRDADSPLAATVRSFMDRGEYVPDELTIRLILGRLHEADAEHGFILDGFPRTEPQAEALDEELRKAKRRVDHALYITADMEELLRRLSGRLICPHCGAIYNEQSKPPKVPGVCDVCGHALERRSDEAPEVVRVRLETYIAQTQPLVAYYRKREVLREIDGGLPVDQVEIRIDQALGLTSLA